MGAQRSLGINIHERSRRGATARRGGRSLPQLSEEPWDARRPTGLPRSEGNGQAFAARLAQTPGWLPQEGRTLAPQEWTAGSCTSPAPSGRPSGAPASPSLCRENTGPEAPARGPRLSQLVGARLQSPAEGCRGASLSALHLNEVPPS